MLANLSACNLPISSSPSSSLRLSPRAARLNIQGCEDCKGIAGSGLEVITVMAMMAIYGWWVVAFYTFDGALAG